MILLLAVDQILLQRRQLDRKKQGRAMVVVAVLIHAILLAAALILPQLSAKATPPKRVIQAQIVPLQALGVPDPPKATKAAQKKPNPEPPKPEAPKPEPPKIEPQVLPEPKVDPPPQTPPPPATKPATEPKPKTPAPSQKLPPPVASQPIPTPSTSPAQEAPEPIPVRAGSEKGSARGQSSFGAAVASLDNPDFTYGYYLDRMVAAIRSRWTRPAVADGTETTLHFRILKNGTIEELSVRTSSGEPIFDRAALRAVGDASPLPPLPVGYRRDSLGVTLVVQ